MKINIIKCGKNLKVETAIKIRRSIRSYKDKKISDKKLKKILYCGTLAPSAKNRQPWKFVAITNKDKILEIAKLIENKQSINVEKYVKNKLKSVNTTVPTAEAIKQAPALILFFKPNNKYWEIGDDLSMGACAENMCLKAVEYKLGSLLIRDIFYTIDEITKCVGWCDDDYILNLALIIGVANDKPKAKPRKHVDDITTWIK